MYNKTSQVVWARILPWALTCCVALASVKWGYSQLPWKLWQGVNELSSGFSLELCQLTANTTQESVSPTASHRLNSSSSQVLLAYVLLSPTPAHPQTESLNHALLTSVLLEPLFICFVGSVLFLFTPILPHSSACSPGFPEP